MTSSDLESNDPHETTLEIFKIVNYDLKKNYQKFQIPHCGLWRNQKLQVSVKGATVKRNVAKFGTHG